MHIHEHSSAAPHVGAPAKNQSWKYLASVLAVTGVIFFAELIGALLSGSLALLSDAMHMLSDSAGLIVALIAAVVAAKGSSAKATYGMGRVEVVASLLNAVTVLAVTVWIAVTAVMRFGAHEEIDVRLMLIVGVIGLAANVIGALILHGHQRTSLNVRGAYLHILVDLFGSLAVIVAGVLMLLTGIEWFDTVASLLIVALILPRACSLAWKALTVLMDWVPHAIEVEELEKEVASLDQVHAVHDVHVWSHDGVHQLGTCHVVVAAGADRCHILDAVQEVFRQHGINHATIQIETKEHLGHETVCTEFHTEPH
ncbi:cation diffusion facilitator family transporter [Corynebacterium flavescens]|uniref:cation diffusion facilitator family transporter n=1 Tax=Corynebacterium flavescens TaxID=28028 RepID=UPI003FD4ED14